MYSWRYWVFSDKKSFFSSRSLLTILLNLGKVSWSRSFTLSRSAICSACPAGLTNWKVVALPSCKQTCNCTLGFPSGEIFWAKENRHDGSLRENRYKICSLLLISEYLCVILKLSLFPTIQPNLSDIKYSSPSFFLSLTWGTNKRMLSDDDEVILKIYTNPSLKKWARNCEIVNKRFRLLERKRHKTEIETSTIQKYNCLFAFMV